MISVPFSGNKRYSYKYVKKIVEEGGYKKVFEPFGGSCVLSVNLLNDGIVDRAVVNDYDRFFDLYPEYLDLKDKVVDECYKAGFKRTSRDSKRGNYVYNDDGSITKIDTCLLPDDKRKILQGIIEKNVPKKFWRYFCYGGNFTHQATHLHKEIYLKDFVQFSCYLKTDKQRAYLKALDKCEMNHLDYRDFLNKYKEELDEDSILIIDPPYYKTYQIQYKGAFSKQDTLNLIEDLNSLSCDYIFFNHDASEVDEWLDGTDHTIQLTGNNASTTSGDRYDCMAYVKHSEWVPF